MSHPPLREVRTIVVPTDFSEPSEEAVTFAARLATRLGARLVLAYVRTEMPGDTTLTSEGEDARELDRRAYELHLHDLPVETRVLHGPAAAEIVRLASAEHADLVVMGTHGRRGLSRALLGSVAEQVLRTAPCPVVSVRPGTASMPPA